MDRVNRETIGGLSIIVRYILTVNEYITVEDMRKSLKKYFPILEDKIMTPAARELMEAGIEQGVEQGIEKGSRMEAEKLVLKVLQKKFGTLSENSQTAIKELSTEKLEILFLDALDFSEQKDLEKWLREKAA